jgi:hypothetical protein
MGHPMRSTFLTVRERLKLEKNLQPKFAKLPQLFFGNFFIRLGRPPPPYLNAFPKGGPQPLSTTVHTCLFCRSVKANDGWSFSGLSFAIDIANNEALGVFLSNGRSPGLRRIRVSSQKYAQGFWNKMLAFWFAQQPFDGIARTDFGLAKITKISLSVFNRQECRDVSDEPGFASLSRIAKGLDDCNSCRFQLLSIRCQVSG